MLRLQSTLFDGENTAVALRERASGRELVAGQRHHLHGVHSTVRFGGGTGRTPAFGAQALGVQHVPAVLFVRGESGAAQTLALDQRAAVPM